MPGRGTLVCISLSVFWDRVVLEMHCLDYPPSTYKFFLAAAGSRRYLGNYSLESRQILVLD